MKEYYVIKNIRTNLYLDWYSASDNEVTVEEIRNTKFKDVTEAEQYLKILEKKGYFIIEKIYECE